MNAPSAPARLWCETLQLKLMAALDAAWALAEASDDPAVVAKAREKAKLCGQIATEARKVAALVPAPRPAAGPISPELAALASMLKASTAEAKAILADLPKPPAAPMAAQAAVTQAALERLKAEGGRRGRP
ncbi:MAG: hypothetical protein JWP92_1464 [Caulobacter sp.]|nr:hypothetical protein [Caulobacter sp.]